MFGMDSVLDKVYECISNCDSGILLLGPRGVGKRLVAEAVARQYLNASSLEYHPDFVLVEPVDGKKSIGVAQVDALHERLRYQPALDKRRVILIDDADTLTNSAQNSLLKALEESQEYNLFILIAHDVLLPTIQSRLSTIKIPALKENDMAEYLLNRGISQDEVPLYMAISSGCIGRFESVYANSKLVTMFKRVFALLANNFSKKVFFSEFHALKEKDKDNFFDINSIETVYILYSFLENVFSSFIFYKFGDTVSLDVSKFCFGIVESMEILDRIRDDISKLRQSYGTNDFFDLLRFIADRGVCME